MWKSVETIIKLISCAILLISCFSHGVQTQKKVRELSLVHLKDTLSARAQAGLSLKKAIVDIETDIISAISPITLSGVLYPWNILSPALAQAQHRSLVESENSRNANLRRTGRLQQGFLSSNVNQIHFDFYQDRSNINNFTRIDLTKSPSSQNLGRIPENTTLKILVHGFQSGPALPFALGAKNAYLKETSHNVIVVDWEMLSLPKIKLTLLYYPAVTANAFRVGEKVAKLIAHLLEGGVIRDLEQVHIIGHSLGAHAAGYAGELVKSTYGKRIGRITGLDPAFLAFIGPDTKKRLDKDDAKFVDAIHTSGVGIYDPIGHVDFYPNGGRNQANCYNEELYEGNPAADSEFRRTFEKLIQSCSHSRAYYYYIKSIKKENLIWACKCVNWKDFRTFCRDSCNHRERFGEYVSPTARGKYFLEIDR